VDGLYILGILDQGSEPTTHAMQDISTFRAAFEEKGLPMYFLFDSKETYGKFNLRNFNSLPSNIHYDLFDTDILKQLNEGLQLENLPIFIIADASTGEVVFKSQGYTIGLGEQLLKVLN
jgi:hypothetical protein